MMNDQKDVRGSNWPARQSVAESSPLTTEMGGVRDVEPPAGHTQQNPVVPQSRHTSPGIIHYGIVPRGCHGAVSGVKHRASPVCMPAPPVEWTCPDWQLRSYAHFCSAAMPNRAGRSKKTHSSPIVTCMQRRSSGMEEPHSAVVAADVLEPTGKVCALCTRG